jgi:DNA-binding GntR family transcriptional regulator
VRFISHWWMAVTALGCNSPWLLHLHALLYAQSERYRRLSVPFATSGRDVNGEHRAILNATLARDTEAAVRLLAAHLEATTHILLDAVVEGRRLLDDTQDHSIKNTASKRNMPIALPASQERSRLHTSSTL